ncbi:MAG: hypothetical protein KAI83_18150 [Thiomargarita sp.]|nr:hypothetical protein [Thiomargarita sp.]
MPTTTFLMRKPLHQKYVAHPTWLIKFLESNALENWSPTLQLWAFF